MKLEACPQVLSDSDPKETPILSIVVPVYNEADSISLFLASVQKVLEQVGSDYEMIFAVDPSGDGTEQILEDFALKDPRIKFLLFSRRIGQPLSIIAGLSFSAGAAAIVMDVDLQDPPELIVEMVSKWQEGYDVVIPQRRSRGEESWTRGLLARVGYKIIKLVANVEIPENCGEFRLLSRRVVQQVVGLKEHHGFLRGLVALVGFKQCTIPFDRSNRVSGHTKYNELTGSLQVGFNGIFCFSTYALTLSTKFGFAIALGAFALAVLYGLLKLLGFPFPIGNPSLAILILFMGGIQLLSVGILGEYIGRIYEEVRDRPKFIIDKTVGFESKK